MKSKLTRIFTTVWQPDVNPGSIAANIREASEEKTPRCRPGKEFTPTDVRGTHPPSTNFLYHLPLFTSHVFI